MQLSKQHEINAPREVVYDALNDAAILKNSIPGCEQLTKKSDTDLTAVVRVKIGPVSAVFNGDVTLSDLDPPNGYTISGQGNGGVAGFAKGKATVRLSEHGEQGEKTLLHYDVEAQVGGKIAQLGARLIDSTAKKLASQFFEQFSAQLQPADNGSDLPSATPTPVAANNKRWLVAGGVVIVAILIAFATLN